MPLDDALGHALLRAIGFVLRCALEWVLEYVFAWLGKGMVYAATLGRVNLAIEDDRDYLLALAAGIGSAIALLTLGFWLHGETP